MHNSKTIPVNGNRLDKQLASGFTNPRQVCPESLFYQVTHIITTLVCWQVPITLESQATDAPLSGSRTGNLTRHKYNISYQK